MRKWITRVAGAGAVAVMTAAPAHAQVLNYSTSGSFSGPGSVACMSLAPSSPPYSGPAVVPPTPLAPGGASCTGAGFTLVFTPTIGENIGTGSITNLGFFSLQGSGSATANPGVLDFTLLINQTTPSAGTGSYSGGITGSVTTNGPFPPDCTGPGNCSSLKWTPTGGQTLTINGVTYKLIFDNVGYAADVGLGIPINNTRNIQAIVTVVPEPASMSLLATGLLGIVAAGWKRRSKQNEE